MSSEDSWVHDGGVPPRGLSHRFFTIDLGKRSVNPSEGRKVGEVEGKRVSCNPCGKVRAADFVTPLGIPRYHWVNGLRSKGIPALVHALRTSAAELCKCVGRLGCKKKLQAIVLKRNKEQ
jgi:hypothetical protein